MGVLPVDGGERVPMIAVEVEIVDPVLHLT
jgi:hypothetical protein